MPRQPLLYVRPKAKYRFPANPLAEQPELAALIAECISSWSQVEAYLALLLSAIMKAETGVASAVFLSVRNSRAQREALTAAAQVELSGRELEMYSAIAVVYQSLDGQRTDLAHGIFAVSEDLPDALLWIEAKDFTRYDIENWAELLKGIKAGAILPSPAPEASIQASLFVYRQGGLD